MRLIPYNRELRPLRLFPGPIGELFDDVFSDGFAGAKWLPAVDVKQTADDVIVRAEIPGIDPKAVHVSIQNDVLTLSGEKSDETRAEEEDGFRVERSYGSFSRTIALPCPVDSKKASATADKGLLTVTLPKRAEDRTRRIRVQVK